MIKPITYQGVGNFDSNLYALEVASRFIDNTAAHGYYKGYGAELAATANGSSIVIGTGAFVVCARMNEITAPESVTVQITSGHVGYIIARIETYHPADAKNCTFIARTAPTIAEIPLTKENVFTPDSNTVNKVYEFPIFSFAISGGGITNITRLIKPIDDYAIVKAIADSAQVAAANAVNTAATATTTASTANATANTANATSTEAKTIANTAQAAATSAVNAATAAASAASTANATANTANVTSTEAKTIAQSANETSSSSKTIADTAQAAATSAVNAATAAASAASTANATANTANATSTEAKTIAQSANTTSAEAKSAANAASNLVAGLSTQIGEKQGTTVTVGGIATGRFEAGSLVAETDTIIVDGGNA